jgi:hypothetical protein
VTNNQANAQARKNGNSFVLVQNPLNNVTGQSFDASKIVYLNGSSDYVDFTIFQGSGSSINIQQGTADGSGTWFSASLTTPAAGTSGTSGTSGSSGTSGIGIVNFTSNFVGAGTLVTLDNLKVAVTTGGSRGLGIGAVSTTFEADVSGWYGLPGGNGGNSANNITYTTTLSGSAFGWNFAAHGDTAQYQIRDKTNNRFYRVTMMIGQSYLSNFISIERLF